MPAFPRPSAIRRPTLSSISSDLIAASLEFVGTLFFLLIGFGGIQAASSLLSTSQAASSLEETLYIATCMGLSLLVSAWMFYRVTGALFNPNISLALLLVGVIGPTRFMLYCIAQLLGAIAAAGIILGLSNAPLAVNTVLTNTTEVKGVFIEMFITAALVLAVLMLAAEKHEATPFAPVGIGLTLFTCHLWAVFFTGAAMNTARAFGPAVVTGFPNGDHWVYWVGPFLGSLVGASFYSLLKHFRYWRLNPHQDTSDPRKSPPDPVEKVLQKVVSTRSGGNGDLEAGNTGVGDGKGVSRGEENGTARQANEERTPTMV